MSCDSLLLENESLKKKIECLSKDLARYFGSHVRFNHIWTYEEEEEEEEVKICHKCKAKVHVNHQCKSKKTVSLDPSYILKF
jgi:hypothetical protein